MRLREGAGAADAMLWRRTDERSASSTPDLVLSTCEYIRSSRVQGHVLLLLTAGVHGRKASIGVSLIAGGVRSLPARATRWQAAAAADDMAIIISVSHASLLLVPGQRPRSMHG